MEESKRQIPTENEETLVDDEWPVPPEERVFEQESRRPPRVGPAQRFGVVLAVFVLLALLGGSLAWFFTGLGATGEAGSASPAPVSPQAAAATATTASTATTKTTARTRTPGRTTTTTTSGGATTERGAVLIGVPPVVGLEQERAASRLRAAGLRVELRLVTSSLAPGVVVGQDPAAGARVERDRTISLQVARRPAPTTVSVPLLTGTTIASARSRLTKLGLRWSVTEIASDENEGIVVGQSPSDGTSARKGTTVTLRVSTGPALVSVPDVMGLAESSARDALAAAGFDVSVVDQPTSDPAQVGVVVAQDPAAAADTAKGATVTISVGRASSP